LFGIIEEDGDDEDEDSEFNVNELDSNEEEDGDDDDEEEVLFPGSLFSVATIYLALLNWKITFNIQDSAFESLLKNLRQIILPEDNKLPSSFVLMKKDIGSPNSKKYERHA